MKRSKSGCFIPIEGPNGAGKTVFIDRLAEALRSMGRRVRCVREPGGTELGERIRSLLKGLDVAHFARALIFNGLRVEHCRKVIEPAVEAGEIVLCDRYFDSTVVYQIFRGDLTEREVSILESIHAAVTQPDLRVFLLPTIKLLRERMRKRDDGVDVFECDPADDLQDYRRVAYEPRDPRGPKLALEEYDEEDQDGLVDALLQMPEFIGCISTSSSV